MAHSIHALIASEKLLRSIHEKDPCSAIIPLSPNLALLPLTDELLDRIERLPVGKKRVETRFEELTPNFKAFIASASMSGALACVFTDYFGGQGVQGALVIKGGEFLYGPSVETNSINSALRRLGVVAEGGNDEFDTVGLGRYRSNEKWIASVKR